MLGFDWLVNCFDFLWRNETILFIGWLLCFFAFSYGEDDRFVFVFFFFFFLLSMWISAFAVTDRVVKLLVERLGYLLCRWRREVHLSFTYLLLTFLTGKDM